MKVTIAVLIFATSLCAAHSHGHGETAQTPLHKLTKEELDAKWGLEVSDILINCSC